MTSVDFILFIGKIGSKQMRFSVIQKKDCLQMLLYFSLTTTTTITERYCCPTFIIFCPPGGG